MNIKQRYLDDAEAKDLTIVEQVNGTRFIFKRNSCGHTFESDISSVRHNKQIFCKTCSKEKLLEFEERFGLTLIEEVSNIRNKYLINSCSHEVTLLKGNVVRNEDIVCPTCENEKFVSNLEKYGLELLEYRTTDELSIKNKSKIAKVRFKDCGHVVNRHRTNKHSYTKCEICAENKRASTYKANGLIVVKPVSSVKSLFKFLSCGHERVMYNSAALRGNCLCQECNESPFNKKSKIYILKITTKDGNEFIKFGYGKDIPNRIREYRMKNVLECSVLLDKDYASGTEAMIIEKAVHKAMKSKVLPADFIRKYLTRGGFTECYPIDALNDLLSELNSVEELQKEKLIKEAYGQ